MPVVLETTYLTGFYNLNYQSLKLFKRFFFVEVDSKILLRVLRFQYYEC